MSEAKFNFFKALTDEGNRIETLIGEAEETISSHAAKAQKRQSIGGMFGGMLGGWGMDALSNWIGIENQYLRGILQSLGMGGGTYLGAEAGMATVDPLEIDSLELIEGAKTSMLSGEREEAKENIEKGITDVEDLLADEQLAQSLKMATTGWTTGSGYKKPASKPNPVSPGTYFNPNQFNLYNMWNQPTTYNPYQVKPYSWDLGVSSSKTQKEG